MGPFPFERNPYGAIGTGMGAVAPNPKDRKSFCGTIRAPPMRSFGRKPRFPRRPPSALRGNIKQSENGPSGPRRQSGGDFQAIHLPKIYTITWGPRKNRVFVGKCCEFPPRNPATLHSWGFAPPFGHPRESADDLPWIPCDIAGERADTKIAARAGVRAMR